MRSAIVLVAMLASSGCTAEQPSGLPARIPVPPSGAAPIPLWPEPCAGDCTASGLAGCEPLPDGTGCRGCLGVCDGGLCLDGHAPEGASCEAACGNVGSCSAGWCDGGEQELPGEIVTTAAEKGSVLAEDGRLGVLLSIRGEGGPALAGLDADGTERFRIPDLDGLGRRAHAAGDGWLLLGEGDRSPTLGRLDRSGALTFALDPSAFRLDPGSYSPPLDWIGATEDRAVVAWMGDDARAPTWISLANGSVLERRDLAPAWRAAFPQGPFPGTVLVAVDGSRAYVALSSWEDMLEEGRSLLAAVELDTQEIAWTLARPRSIDRLLADGAGVVASGLGTGYVTALDVDGGVRFESGTGWFRTHGGQDLSDGPVASSSGLVYLVGGRAIDRATGAERFLLPYAGLQRGNLWLTGGAAFLGEHEAPMGGNGGRWYLPGLAAVDPRDGTVLYRRFLGFSRPVLLGAVPDEAGIWLELATSRSGEGSRRFLCRMTGDAQLVGTYALGRVETHDQSNPVRLGRAWLTSTLVLDRSGAFVGRELRRFELP